MSVQVYDQENLTIFWDYETTRLTSASATISTYELVKNIRAAAAPFGPIKAFRAYSDFSSSSQTSPRSTNARSELSSSGVTLVDCPGDGRKELCPKIMLVDILIHAWDHPAPHTFVVVTGDRDLAYAISLLRTRNYRVVLICPAVTHPDLIAQASVQLDWSRVVLGIRGGIVDDDFLDRPTATKEPLPSSFSRNTPQETPSTTHFTPGPRKTPFSDLGHSQNGRTYPFEEHAMPPSGRRNSVFSTHYDPHKINVFNNEFVTPKSGRGSVPLGDGPLFPRPQSQGGERADSAPPNIHYSTGVSTPSMPAYPPSTENFTGPGFVPSSLKGKQKDAHQFDHFEPDGIVAEEPLQSPSHIPYSGSIFEPFGETGRQFPAMSASPLATDRGHSTRTSSFSSSASARSKFSIVYHPELSTAPTSAEPASVADKSDVTVKASTTTVKDSTKVDTMDTVIPPAPSHGNSDISTSAPIDQRNVAESVAIPPADEPMKKETEAVSLPMPQPAAPASSTFSNPASITESSVVSSVPSKPLVSSPKLAVTPSPTTLSNPPPTSKPLAVSSQAVPPTTPGNPRPRSNTTPAPVSRTSTVNPSASPKFSVLVQTLRKEQRGDYSGGVPKSILGEFLLRQSPTLYQTTGHGRFGDYIAAAVQAGIVDDVKYRGKQCVKLRRQYA